MDYYGLLFLYYLKGLSGKSILRLFFNIEAGGTEQLLPENTSVPTTTPILADIQYPDGLRTDQYFTYRETPTTVSNKARIKTIKGNTLVWNQLVQNGNFADGTNGWTRRYAGTISASNNILTYSYTDSTEISDWQTEVKTPPINLPANHKVIISYDVKPNGAVGSKQHVADTGSGIVLFDVSPSTIPDGTWTHCTYYGSFNVDIVHFQFRMAGTNITNGFTANLKNVQIFDLTQMGLDFITSVDEFTSLFPLPYYDYCQGAMLSFGGRNVKFNQLVQNGNFADTSLWRTYASTGFSVSNNVGSFTVTGDTGAIYQTNTPAYVSGHKYLVIADFYVSQQTNISVEVSGTRGKAVSVNANTWYRYSDIVTPSAQGNFSLTCGQASVQVKNVMCFDLTEMFGAGNEPSAEGFFELFPNDYYEYTTGKYMNLGQPVSLKTVGKNQVANVVGGYFNAQSSTITVNNGGESFVFYAWKGKTYYASSSIALNRNVIAQCDTPNLVNGSPIYNPVNFGNSTETKWTATWTGWTVWYVYDASSADVENSAQVEIGTSATEYEPYTSSTLSLPISTYFPTGMKSAGSVYDELTPTKAITRIDVVDLGSLTWTYDSSVPRFYTTDINTLIKKPANIYVEANAVSSMYVNTTFDKLYTIEKKNMTMAFGNTGTFSVINTSYSDANAFKTAMSGVYLYYELATPTETPITTEDANEALSLLMGKSVSSSNANQLINIITKGE